MKITGDMLLEIGPSGPKALVDQIAEKLTQILDEFKICGIYTRSAIIGQAMVETNELNLWTEEEDKKRNPGFRNYERGRIGRTLGNIRYSVKDGDALLYKSMTDEGMKKRWPAAQLKKLKISKVPGLGSKYRGHGLWMVTGYDNTYAYDEWVYENLGLDVDLIGDPSLMSIDTKLAVAPDLNLTLGIGTIPFYYLTHRRKNEKMFDHLMDISMPKMPRSWSAKINSAKVANNGFKEMTRNLNGGTTHYERRAAYFLRALQVLSACQEQQVWCDACVAELQG